MVAVNQAEPIDRGRLRWYSIHVDDPAGVIMEHFIPHTLIRTTFTYRKDTYVNPALADMLAEHDRIMWCPQRGFTYEKPGTPICGPIDVVIERRGPQTNSEMEVLRNARDADEARIRMVSLVSGITRKIYRFEERMEGPRIVWQVLA